MKIFARLSFLLAFLMSGVSAQACPTCSVAAAFTPQTLLLSLLFAAIPASLMVLLWYRVYREELYKKAAKELEKNEQSGD